MQGYRFVVGYNDVVLKHCTDIESCNYYKETTKYGLYGYVRYHNIFGDATYHIHNDVVFLQFDALFLVRQSGYGIITDRFRLPKESFMGFLDYCDYYESLDTFKIDWRKAGF